MGRWFSIPPKRWFDLLLVTGLVTAVSVVMRGPTQAPSPFVTSTGNSWVPPPAAASVGEGGVAVLTPGKDAPVQVSLDGDDWLLKLVRYSRHDDQQPVMLDHEWRLRGRIAGIGGGPAPRSAPHARVSIEIEALGPVAEYFLPERLLLRDEHGRWYPPIRGSQFAYALPPDAQPTALGWRAGPADHCVTVYYRGVAYGPDFVPGRGNLYVATDAAGNDGGWEGGVNVPMDIIDERRFVLCGVDMRQWTEKHAKDRGFGNTKVLIQFDRSKVGGGKSN